VQQKPFSSKLIESLVYEIKTGMLQKTENVAVFEFFNFPKLQNLCSIPLFLQFLITDTLDYV